MYVTTLCVCHYIANDPQSLSSKQNNCHGKCALLNALVLVLQELTFHPFHVFLFFLQIIIIFASGIDLFAVTYRLKRASHRSRFHQRYSCVGRYEYVRVFTQKKCGLAVTERKRFSWFFRHYVEIKNIST